MIKKSAFPRSLPGIHPGLQQRILDAEAAEIEGRAPKALALDEAQKVLRPTLDTPTVDRQKQARAIGLVDPAYRRATDGLAELAAQAPFRPGEDLDAIWDSLSEKERVRAGATERFRLEMTQTLAKVAKPWTSPHQIAGKLDARNLRRSLTALSAELAAFEYLLADDSLVLLRRFFRETQDLITQCQKQRTLTGVDGAATHRLLRDWLAKLVYQELSSRRRAMGDFGVRCISGKLGCAEELLGSGKLRSPHQRMLLRFIYVHLHLGYTAYAARVSYRGSLNQRQYGARITTDELDLHRAFFTHDELTLAQTAIATAGESSIGEGEIHSVMASVRLVELLAPFLPGQLFRRFSDYPSVEPFLGDLMTRAHARDWPGFVAAKEALAQHIMEGDESALPRPLCDDLMAAFRPLERRAPLLMPPTGTLVSTIGGGMDVLLEPEPFSALWQPLFESGQDHLHRALNHQDGPRLRWR